MPASSDSRIPVAPNTAIMAASRRCWNEPAHARSSLAKVITVEDRDRLVRDVRRLSPIIGSGTSSSAASHLKNCCSARNWLLAHAALYLSSSETIHSCTSCLPILWGAPPRTRTCGESVGPTARSSTSFPDCKQRKCHVVSCRAGFDRGANFGADASPRGSWMLSRTTSRCAQANARYADV